MTDAAPPADLSQIRGSLLPRLWSPPLVTGPPGGCPCGCALTRQTSLGFMLNDFAAAIGLPFDPWQKLLSVHALELLPDGRPRWRKLLIIVARQNGKTRWAKVLILFWMFVQRVALIIATHTDRGMAKRLWEEIIAIAEADPFLSQDLPEDHVRLQLLHEDFWNSFGAHFRFGAPNRRVGRGDTVYKALLDEIREHATRAALTAVEGATNAVDDAQIVMISNQGDRRAVVLRGVRDAALAYMHAGVGDPRIGLIEWSAPEGSKPTDMAAIAMANPNLGTRIRAEDMLGMAMTAEAAGGDDLDDFLCEYACIGIELFKAAIDLAKWRDRGPKQGRTRVDLAQHRRRLALCLDVSVDGKHVTLAGAAVVDGLVHVEIIQGWESTKAARADLAALVHKLKPRAFAWLPGGPAAAIMVELANPKTKPLNESGRAVRWPPQGVELVEITSEVTAVCMGFAEQIESDELRHDGHALALAHVRNAVRLMRGESGAWVFARRDAGHVDGVYAMAGAVHVARSLPPPPPPLRVS